jgi:hypothetical protein
VGRDRDGRRRALAAVRVAVVHRARRWPTTCGSTRGGSWPAS